MQWVIRRTTGMNGKMKKPIRFDPSQYHRRSIRLRNFDYGQPSAYFVTICARDRECLFGQIEDGKILLNRFGLVLEEEWHRTAQIRPGLKLDAFCIMPNHIHGIIILTGSPLSADRRGTMHRAPTIFEQFGKPTSNSIPSIVRGFKSASTVGINEIRSTPGTPVWQRSYYEHVIRNEIDLEDVRQYIESNPFKWLEDKEHPANLQTP
jgi:REP element-mobilizing transposase RayT